MHPPKDVDEDDGEDDVILIESQPIDATVAPVDDRFQQKSTQQHIVTESVETSPTLCSNNVTSSRLADESDDTLCANDDDDDDDDVVNKTTPNSRFSNVVDISSNKSDVETGVTASQGINSIKHSASCSTVSSTTSTAICSPDLNEKPPSYTFIQTNQPVGEMKKRHPASRLSSPSTDSSVIADIPVCECKADEKPCVDDECLNRLLQCECHPSTCPAGQECKNQ